MKRDGIELTGSQTLTIPVEMRVGGLEETITVTGESPVVDVQNARREIVLSSETIQTIPATRAAGALLNATPGIIVGEAGAGDVADDDRRSTRARARSTRRRWPVKAVMRSTAFR